MSRIRIASLLVGCFLVSAVVVPAAAQNGAGYIADKVAAMQKNFTAADKDKDGFLTRDEAKAMPFVSKHFDEIDTQKTGKVSEKDIGQYLKTQAEKRRDAQKPPTH
ncbi:EF hand domain-containing protein [Luteibacter rhizovicinus]|uniref:EF hand domain-containing protein n=1 Tax=Luteibacter rhizovicinus TaxID=242606 RepID=A0A4R3YQV4_9GAMM|nr:EF-hand domain-containing protein [Luteibacter rhizovicinus]TCV93333.1 EF hand domain-containing protein [Luteibacter rhizovicinus]